MDDLGKYSFNNISLLLFHNLVFHVDKIINDLQNSKFGVEEKPATPVKDSKKAAKAANPMFEEFGTARNPPSIASPANRTTLDEADNIIASLQGNAIRPDSVKVNDIDNRQTIAEVDRLIGDLESLATVIPPQIDSSPATPIDQTPAKPGKTIQAIPSNQKAAPSGFAKLVPNGAAKLVSKSGQVVTAVTPGLPSCEKCKGPVNGNSVTIASKVWHSEHFQCHKCNIVLSPLMFFEKDGIPYCDKDYKELFSPKCSYCNGIITEVCSVPNIALLLTTSH